MADLNLNRRQYLELEKLAIGAFAPLSGFMNHDEFESVVEHMRLPGGEPFPLPILLDLTREQSQAIENARTVTLFFEGKAVGEVAPKSFYTCDKAAAAEQIFGTQDRNHPGVAHFFRMGDFFLGGPVQLTQRAAFPFSEYERTPSETRAYFKERGWRTIVGFQTRNVPHRAHEYLQRLALEQADGLFIQPLVGAKKRGDYTPGAVLAAYEVLIDRFLPRERVLLGIISTFMRFAGPREAVFHALIRRNYGCTHFIIGRDHAGVGNYYAKYAAHDLARRFDGQLGIEVLRFCGPFHCSRCGGIVTERTCPHLETEPEATREISGTLLRSLLSKGAAHVPELLRPEILTSLQGVPLFLEEDAE